MKPTRRWLLGLGLVGIAAGAKLVDALVVTERERVEAFVDDVTGPVTPERVERALRYVDADRQPVEVSVQDAAVVYGPGQTEALRVRARDRVRPYQGQTLRVFRRTVTMGAGDASALVSLQVFSSELMVRVEFALRRHGRDWLVESARFR